VTSRTHRVLLLTVGLASAAVAALVVLSTHGSGDYVLAAPVAGDNAAPFLNAIAHGNLAVAAGHQPLMGLVSLALRAPVVIVASLSGASGLLSYRLGALVCLLPLALLCAGLISVSATRGGHRVALMLAALLVLAGPATIDAVTVGHPEEVLAITLATAAVLAGLTDRPLAAAVLLGLAVGTKPWALLAAAPVAVAVPRGRPRMLAIAGLVAVPCLAILPLANPAAFADAGSGVGASHLVNPLSLWWPLGRALAGAPGVAVSDHRLPLGFDRSVAAMLALAIALVVAGLLAERGRRRGRQLDPLALLALLGLIRCAVDPLPLEYNLVATLVPLAAWEVVERGRIPLVTAGVAVAGALLYGARMHTSPAATSALTIAFVLALGAYLARDAFHRRIRSLAAAAGENTRPMPSLASGVPA
jgi:hypothetical protein